LLRIRHTSHKGLAEPASALINHHSLVNLTLSSNEIDKICKKKSLDLNTPFEVKRGVVDIRQVINNPRAENFVKEFGFLNPKSIESVPLIFKSITQYTY